MRTHLKIVQKMDRKSDRQFLIIRHLELDAACFGTEVGEASYHSSGKYTLRGSLEGRREGHFGRIVRYRDRPNDELAKKMNF